MVKWMDFCSHLDVNKTAVAAAVVVDLQRDEY